MTESGQLRFPSYAGAVPVKSKRISSPASSTVQRIGRSALDRLDDVLRLAAPVGEAGESGAHHPLGVRVELVHRGHNLVPPAPLAQLVEAPLREPVRGELRAEVATPLLRPARLGDELARAPRR